MSLKINNISFIVITLNEAFAIKKCLDSIRNLSLQNCEIICIDSGSTDATIANILEYRKNIKNLSLFQIMGCANAAIARNIGIKKSTKDIIFFIDGDVEIKEKFLNEALHLLRNDVAGAVVGKLTDYRYDSDYRTIESKVDDRYFFRDRKLIFSSGGIFIAKRSVVDSTGYFPEQFVTNEDLDYTLRLSAKHKMLAIPEYMGIHHTVPYGDWSRLKKNLFRVRPNFGKVIIRNIVSNPWGVLILLLKNKGITYGLLYYLVMSLVFIWLKAIGLILSLFILLIDISNKIVKKENCLLGLYTHYILPFLIMIFIVVPNKNFQNYQIVEIL